MEYAVVIVEKTISNPNDKVNPQEVENIEVKSGIVDLSEDNPNPFQLLQNNLFDISGLTLNISIDGKKISYPIYSKFMDSNAPMKTVDEINKALQKLIIYPNPDIDIEILKDREGNQLSAAISVQKNMFMWTSM